MPTTPSPLEQIPPPVTIRERMGQLYRELALLRRLLRIAEEARQVRPVPSGGEVAHAC